MCNIKYWYVMLKCILCLLLYVIIMSFLKYFYIIVHFNIVGTDYCKSFGYKWNYIIFDHALVIKIWFGSLIPEKLKLWPELLGGSMIRAINWPFNRGGRSFFWGIWGLYLLGIRNSLQIFWVQGKNALLFQDWAFILPGNNIWQTNINILRMKFNCCIL